MTKATRPSVPPHIQQYMNAHEQMAIGFPSLTNALLDETDKFRGLTAFLGDNANVVVGLKRWGFDGQPEILWSSGDDFIAALLSLDAACKSGKWKVDKRAKL